MLRTMSVRPSPSPRVSPRRTSPTPQASLQTDRLSLLQRYRFGPVLVCVFLCLAGVSVYMWPRVQVVRLAYRMQASEQQLRSLLQTHDQLRLELASLKDPQRIYRIATEQLGMSMPGRDQLLIVTHKPQAR